MRPHRIMLDGRPWRQQVRMLTVSFSLVSGSWLSAGGLDKSTGDRGEDMTRRWTGHMKGEQYIGNTESRQVHGLENEKTNCQIDEIVQAWNDRPFKTVGSALAAGYENCAYCLGRSQAKRRAGKDGDGEV